MAAHKLEHEEGDPEDDAEERPEEDDEDEYGRGVPKLPWGIRKKVIKEAPVANWARGLPANGDKVSVHFTATLQDGVEVGTSRNSGKPFSFVLNEKPREVVLGMEMAVQTMRQGEVAQFTVAPRFAYDDLGSPPLVPPGATIIFEVELIDWETLEDLFGDGTAVKTVLQKGRGTARPSRGHEVIMSMTCTDKKGRLLEEHRSVEHTVGDPAFGPLSRIVVNALMSMLEGERASVALSRYCISEDRRFQNATVDFTLEKIYEVTDISPLGNNELVKKALTGGGAPACLGHGDRVRLHVLSATDGREPLPGFVGPTTLEFISGDGEVCDALEFVAMNMAINERSLLTCKPASSQCCEPKLGLADLEAEKVVLAVQLVSVQPASGRDQKSAPTLLTEQLALARARKEVAGGLYKRARYGLALDAYRRILAALDSEAASAEEEPPDSAEPGNATPSSRPVDGEVAELRRACELNRAACLLKLGDVYGARASCEEVLRSDPSNVKALYRRASANFGLSNYGEALQDLTKVVTLEPRNTEARALILQVKESQQRYAKDAKQAAARMLGQELPRLLDDDKQPQGAARAPPAPRLQQLFSCLLPCLPCVPSRGL